MNRDSFRDYAKSAIVDGSKARAELARAQAEKFLAGSTAFNPTALQGLGSSGLRHFLASIDMPELSQEYRGTTAPQSQIEDAPTKSHKPLSWADLRRSEPLWTVRAIAYGVITGLLLLGLGATTLNFVYIGLLA